MRRTFDRGDIVNVNLEPVVGRELQGAHRYALVLTSRSFNQLGDVLVAPITQGAALARYAGFAVSLMNTGCRTQGVALINKCRMMDLQARQAVWVEHAPPAVIDDALARLMALLE